MNEKTRTMIEEMKNQTFGVEVEMNNITRMQAARIAAKHFGTMRAEDTERIHGYSARSAWDRQGREWRFQYDSSIAGAPGRRCEMVIPVLTYEDMESLQELLRKLRKAGAKSDGSRCCGIHIHIGMDGHNPRTLRNLANIMASHEELLAGALKLDRHRVHQYCRMIGKDFLRELNTQKPSTMSELAEIWYRENGASARRDSHYNPSRYHMLNMHTVFTKGTIEFRLFQFDEPEGERANGIHAGQMKSYIQLCLALSNMAKTLKSASPKPQQVENPKYAMRTWLLRLGFIGEEFKTARNVFTTRLEGSAAFR